MRQSCDVLFKSVFFSEIMIIHCVSTDMANWGPGGVPFWKMVCSVFVFHLGELCFFYDHTFGANFALELFLSQVPSTRHLVTRRGNCLRCTDLNISSCVVDSWWEMGRCAWVSPNSLMLWRDNEIEPISWKFAGFTLLESSADMMA